MLVIRAMFQDATTKVRLNGRESRAFNVKVGIHQGSVLSLLLTTVLTSWFWRLCPGQRFPTCWSRPESGLQPESGSRDPKVGRGARKWVAGTFQVGCQDRWKNIK